MLFTGGVAGGAAPTQAIPDPASRTGLSADKAAASCWEVKQLHPSSVDGSYWLLTPRMTAPGQFWCDMTTDGGGWVRVASGREQWSTAYDGKGDGAQLRQAKPPLDRAIQLPSTTIDALLDGGRVDDLDDGIRVRRATNAAGTSWQEVRFGIVNRDRWVWTMGAEHRVSTYRFDGVSGSGGNTYGFGSGTGTGRVNASVQSAQGFRWGFAHGTGVAGTPDATTHLWSQTVGAGSAFPAAHVYLRPRLTSADLAFAAVPDAGTVAIKRPDVASSLAQVSPWGVTGLAGSSAKEGNVEVQAFEQIGNVMFVGGNFRYVQQDSAGTGRVDHPFLAAFDATTGAYIPGFKPVLNEQVRALQAMPGGRLAVGGDFNQANGAPVQGLVILDPATGKTVPSTGVVIENQTTAGVARVESLDLGGSYLYIGGAFTHLARPDGTKRVFARNAGRISATTSTPSTWNPNFNGTVLDVAVSDDLTKAYFAGFFSSAGSTPTFRVAAIQTSGTGAADPTPWTPTWSNSSKDYQRAIDQGGDFVWVGGSEHALFNFSTTNYERLGGNITKTGGDFQAIVSEGDQLYAGCHCNNWTYSDAHTWPSVGTGWSQADAIGWFGLWDNQTGDYVPHFTPEFSLRTGSGVWAIEVADDGTVWAGGDIVGGSTTAGSRWLGGFARWAPRDSTAPSAPKNLRATSQTSTSVSLAWDAASGGVTGYQVLRDDRVVATTRTARTITAPKGGKGRFFVRAVDAAGNVSASTPVLLTGTAAAQQAPATKG